MKIDHLEELQKIVACIYLDRTQLLWQVDIRVWWISFRYVAVFFQESNTWSLVNWHNKHDMLLAISLIHFW